jgi:hypothetical protein
MIPSLRLLLGLCALLPNAVAAPTTALAVRGPPVGNDCSDDGAFGSSRYEGVLWEEPLEGEQYFCATKWREGRVITGLEI